MVGLALKCFDKKVGFRHAVFGASQMVFCILDLFVTINASDFWMSFEPPEFQEDKIYVGSFLATKGRILDFGLKNPYVFGMSCKSSGFPTGIFQMAF